MKRRTGKFKLAGSYMRTDHYQDLLVIQKDIAVLHLESEAWKDQVTIFATGPMFDEIDEGEIIPLYCANIRFAGGDLSVTFTKAPKPYGGEA